MKRISYGKALELYKEYGTPEHVIRHCKGVTMIALTIARALNRCGYDLDTGLIFGAGITHDMARVQERHWEVAADKLVELGYSEEAELVRHHMTGVGYSPIETVNEQDMIWLGDRLIKEDTYVGIDERFRYIEDKALKRGEGQKGLDRIRKSKAEMQRLMDGIAGVIGCTIDELIGVGTNMADVFDETELSEDAR
ncbi:MAG: HD domain-containing protein [Firmicutes bacterium]|nr:HD domain-containing protein [Bacillota bacterium]